MSIDKHDLFWNFSEIDFRSQHSRGTEPRHHEFPEVTVTWWRLSEQQPFLGNTIFLDDAIP